MAGSRDYCLIQSTSFWCQSEDDFLVLLEIMHGHLTKFHSTDMNKSTGYDFQKLGVTLLNYILLSGQNIDEAGGRAATLNYREVIT